MPKWVVVVGTPELGYSIHGPFLDTPTAHDWIEEQTVVEYSVCVMSLIDPADGYYLGGDEETTDGQTKEHTDPDAV